jgi:hypothetical protein
MPPIRFTSPNNLGISQRLAVFLALGAILTALVVIVVVAIVWGDERTTNLTVNVIGTLTLAIIGLVTTLKSAEAADTAAKTKNVAELTASQTAAIAQVMVADGNGNQYHCAGCICAGRKVQ